MNKIIGEIREMFPALHQRMNDMPLIYLDNAATTQKPLAVLEAIAEMNSTKNANVHRSVYDLSYRATALYEEARERVRKFINARQCEEIIFTSGTTASINLVAECFCSRFLRRGDAILITASAHHSNIVPWQLVAEKHGAEIRVLPVCTEGEEDSYNNTIRSGRLMIEKMGELLSDGRVRIIAVEHISNVLGMVNPIKEIVQIAHAQDIPVLIDGAQGIVHEKVDVQELDCDFYTFSAHKIFGATGVGILYGKKKWLEEMPPYMGGGEMVETVTYQKTTYAALPLKFEAGTPNFIGAASLTPAIDFIEKTREIQEVADQERGILEYIPQALCREVGDVELYGWKVSESIAYNESGKPLSYPYVGGCRKVPLFTFNIKGCNAGDVAQLLDKMGIAVRSGQMCAEPLLREMGVSGAIRASFSIYNTLEEGEIFISALRKAKAMLL